MSTQQIATGEGNGSRTMTTKGWAGLCIGFLSVLILLGVNLLAAARNNGALVQGVKNLSEQVAELKGELKLMRGKVEALQMDDRYRRADANADFAELRRDVKAKDAVQDERVDKVYERIEALATLYRLLDKEVRALRAHEK